jgi:hypothetical protein
MSEVFAKILEWLFVELLLIIDADVDDANFDFDKHTFAKCPFFEQSLHVASLAGHLLRGCLLLPQK